MNREPNFEQKVEALNFFQEYDDFFREMIFEDPERYQEILEIGRGVQFSPETNLISLIPCYAIEQELKRTLMAYANQQEKSFEIIIFINAGPEMSDEEFSENKRRLENQIKTAKEEYGLKIHSFARHFQGKPVLGNLRSVLAEVACFSAVRAQIKDPILISADADCLWMSPNYVSGYRNRFKRNPKLDYVIGRIGWDSEYSQQNAAGKDAPELLIEQRILNLIEILTKNHGALRTAYPAATAMRASSYLASGGYDKNSAHNEDARLLAGMRDFRCNDPKYRGEITGRVITSSRRTMRGIISGNGLIGQWLDFKDATWLQEDVTELIDVYKARSGFIQVDDISKALKGNADSIRKIESRVNWLLKRLFFATNIWRNGDFIMDFLNRSGIRLKRVNKAEDVNKIFMPVIRVDLEGHEYIADLQGIEIDFESSKRALHYLAKYYNLMD